MRSLEDASASWQELKQYRTLSDLRQATRVTDTLPSHIAGAGLRSAAWKSFLLFDSVDTAEWPKVLAASRSAYESLRTHFLRHLDNPDEYGGGDDSETQANPTLENDTALLAEIRQDVDRCMPENHYFLQPPTQQKLLDILFVWSKLNQDVSYRQGMHELLAPILWVVDRDAIDLGQSSKVHGEDATVRVVFDAENVEHDAFALFSRVMQSAKGFYEGTTHQAGENPIVVRSRRIFEEMLPQIDSELAAHLHRIEIVPQVFLIRWIRLLFGREFGFDDLLALWDALFANDTTLELVNHICIAMLLRLRWELLAADYNSALALLLRYPSSPARDHPPQTLVHDALYLRDHPNYDGAAYLVLKYTGRPLQSLNRALTPPALQRNITAFSGISTLGSGPISPIRQRNKHLQRPSSASNRQQSGLEVMLSSTARDIYARGTKTVRSAVDEVHKRAQEIRDVQTPSLPPRGTPGREVGPEQLLKRVAALEKRNKQLGKLLEGAVGELWEFQRFVAEKDDGLNSGSGDEKKEGIEADLERLSVAVAKVQFVQVYLEDASLPLPVDEEGVAAAEHMPAMSQIEATIPAQDYAPQEKEVETIMHPQSKTLADPDSFEEMDSGSATPARQPQPQGGEVPRITVGGSDESDAAKGPRQDSIPVGVTAAHERSTLAEGSYSWMLGESETKANATRPTHSPGMETTVPATPERRPQAKGFLFGEKEGGSGDGDADDEDGGGSVRGNESEGLSEPPPTLVVARSRRNPGKGRKVLAAKERLGDGDDVFR
ncbi:hypothetical protein LTR78_005399 [Recurvomyces mirabilis]|uniref:Rab-GAP TBC domain-containing protein n=1 Tax=Recurvomyces mirabilis TaxID=574656 RepID=A0AAE0WMX7_9PEZI|nr:hypothetical protein LTR78_005399 [Recurvomyces mirabilis]KAK5152694.1 hypothetical protein LTS14_008228 [Recurvomyces mirabilis]